MGSGKGSKGTIAKYLISMHMGLCMSGPGIRLTQMWYGEKKLWSGTQTAQGAISVDKTSLFGGRKKEGGVKGAFWWLPGAATQVLPDSLAQRFAGKPGAQTIGYRGIASVFVTGPGPKGGANVAANNPYLRPFWFRVTRPPFGLDSTKALIPRQGSAASTGSDANPAHFIYELLTNVDWGMGAPTSKIDTAAFNAAGDTLFAENFGLSFHWTRQSKIESMIAEVLDHIQATLYVDPASGLMTIKLLRGDYNVESLPEINPSNANLANFQRRTWGETVNEIVLTYTSPTTAGELTITVQDLGGIAAQGGVVSSSRSYPGIHYRALASRVAARDLAAAAAPLATCTATLDRSLWDKANPGGVINLRWPEKGIERVTMRISKVDRGAPGSPTITLSLMEDVFGLDYTKYVEDPDESADEDGVDPAPIERVALYTAPLYMTLAALGRNVSTDLPYPECITGVLALPQTAGDISFEMMAPVMKPNGVPAPTSVATLPFTGGAKLVDALPAATASTVASLSEVVGVAPQSNSFIVIGDGSEANSEIALVVDVTVSGWQLRRGILDTIPRTWAAGTQIWTIPGTNSVDPTIRSENETVVYRLLPSTSTGELDYAAAPDQAVTLTKRPHRPFRPANIKVNGLDFTTVNLSAAADVTVTWSNRNRNVELTVPLAWSDATVAPETGQTTSIILQKASDNSVITSFDNLTGTTYTFPKSAFAGNTDCYVQVRSMREGLSSLQSARIRVSL